MFTVKLVHLKKFTAVFLAAVCLVTFVGCDNGQYIDDPYVGEYASDNLFENIAPYTEYEELTELNEAIDRIKAVDISYGDDFAGFDILGKVKAGMQSISFRWPAEHSASVAGFDWFVDGAVDVDLLESKIRQNTESRGINITDELAVYIRKTAEAIKADIEYIKDAFPGFYFSCAFKKVDSLYVDFTSEEDYLAYCTVTFDDVSGIFYNKDVMESETPETYEATFYHEAAHLLSQCEHDEVIYNGVEINDAYNTGAPMNNYYFTEGFAIYMQSVFVCGDEMNTQMEKAINELWTLSTGTTQDDFAKAYACKDVESFIRMLEPELQDASFYFSLFYALNLWLDLSDGEEDSVSDIDQFREDCFRYFYINIIRNAYIRLMKEYACGKITAEEARDGADTIGIAEYNYVCYFAQLNDETCEEKVYEMQAIFEDYITNNSY